MITDRRELLDMACHSRRLAGTVAAGETARALEEMARTYESRARAVDALRFLQGASREG